MIVVEDDKPAAKMTEQAGESCHDCVRKRSQSRAELLSDPAECGDGIADSEGSRQHAEGGRSSNNATNAKEEDAPSNQDVIEIDQDAHRQEREHLYQQSIKINTHCDY